MNTFLGCEFIIKDNILASLKLRPGLTEMKDELLLDLIEDTIIDVQDYTNTEEGFIMPKGCIGIIKDIVVIKANKLGAEGLASESYSGVSQSFLDDLPKDLFRKLKRFRKLPR
ncbi:phage head-tail connector protein [Clostridium gasigenes]|uniref:phage head-tail connector protein n=1 Tax=Clostridium gasigenes TaxID=94869 RepID=UPI001628CDD1|nr:phage head-tail connector protein [Clostridium gasigenes]MBB6622238.1 phage head-tail connector protein [Clostridium gasigenes]